MIWDRIAHWANPDGTVEFGTIATAFSLPASAYASFVEPFRQHGWTLIQSPAKSDADPLADRGYATPGRPLYDRWTRPHAAADAHVPAVSLRAIMPVIHEIAESYVSHQFPLEDALQEGIIGALKVAPRFDPTRNVPFAQFVRSYVLGAIQREARKQSRTIGIPHGRLEVLSRIEQARWQLTPDLGHEPTIAELAHALDLTPETVEQHLAWAESPKSLDSPAFPEDSETLGDHVADADLPDWANRIRIQLWRDQGWLRAASITVEEILEAHSDASDEVSVYFEGGVL